MQRLVRVRQRQLLGLLVADGPTCQHSRTVTENCLVFAWLNNWAFQYHNSFEFDRIS